MQVFYSKIFLKEYSNILKYIIIFFFLYACTLTTPKKEQRKEALISELVLVPTNILVQCLNRKGVTLPTGQLRLEHKVINKNLSLEKINFFIDITDSSNDRKVYTRCQEASVKVINNYYKKRNLNELDFKKSLSSTVNLESLSFKVHEGNKLFYEGKIEQTK